MLPFRAVPDASRPAGLSQGHAPHAVLPVACVLSVLGASSIPCSLFSGVQETGFFSSWGGVWDSPFGRFFLEVGLCAWGVGGGLLLSPLLLVVDCGC